MLKPLRTLFRKAPAAPPPSTPAGTRIYAIGDIHGCDRLFDALIDAIEADDAEAKSADTTMILLGDLVDRGPGSAQVIARAREWGRQRKVRYLAGNHEDMFLDSFEDRDILKHFLKHGGRDTILSYGIDIDEYNRLDIDQLRERLHTLVPQEDRDFLNSFEEIILAGDYAFVHAGIDPSRPLDEQSRKDMLWIRERFLSHSGGFEKVIVHGHTIFEEVENRPGRIGIDTGAFRFGRLTALVLEGETRRYIQARQGESGEEIEIVKWGSQT